MAKYTIEIEDVNGAVVVTATGCAKEGEKSHAQALLLGILFSVKPLQKVGDDMVRQGVVVPAARKQTVH